MTSEDAAAVWADVALASALLAIDPSGLGGIALRSAPGAERDEVCAQLRALSPASAPFARIPLHITEDRLLGGLSLAATLRAGQVVAERGVLAQADGGLVVVAMAERLDATTCAHLCAALDRGRTAVAREGISAVIDCRVGIIALDEGIEDERVASALADRLAFHLDLTRLERRTAAAWDARDALATDRARARLRTVTLGDDVVDALCRAAHALGIASLRAPLLAAAAARAHAALAGRTRVEEADAAVAARLVLGPRAKHLPTAPPPSPDPASAQDEPEEQDEHAAQDPPRQDEPQEADTSSPRAGSSLEEVVVAAAKSAMPDGLLDALATGREPRLAPRTSGSAGVLRASSEGGRPAGTRPGQPRNGDRLNVVETLRAAAPWQALRARERGTATRRARIEVRKDDFRITRFARRAESCVVFAVDASGSAALQRLAEAKGAVEQVLADCYVRRDHVALVAFRNTSAALLLPPTRSLARVRRCLADLVGGGTTPLAAGIDAALALSLEARKRGRTPIIVLMTDGRANVALDGRAEGASATADSLASARAVRAAGIRSLFLDTAPRPRPQGRALAQDMGAHYLPLPYVDAAGISRRVQALAEGRP